MHLNNVCQTEQSLQTGQLKRIVEHSAHINLLYFAAAVDIFFRRTFHRTSYFVRAI